MNYKTIKYYDIANGTGVRTSLFVSGCTHRCKGCFNPEAWDFQAGQVFTKEVEEEILKSLAPDYISGLSLLGGEPMEIPNQRALVGFLRTLKIRFPNKNIWCYTGYVYDTELVKGGRAYCEVTEEILGYIDILVDGKFEEELYDMRLRFRGSANQRIIDIKKSKERGKIIEVEI